MLPFKITVKAREDLTGIARYTEQRWGRDQRKLYLKQIDDAFHALSKTPELGQPCDDIRAGYLKYPQGSHVIFYRFGTDTRIEIIRILHKRMDVLVHL